MTGKPTVRFCCHPQCKNEAIECRLYDFETKAKITEWYCPDHASEHGYCCICGEFWAGCESFDLSPVPGVCPNCRDQMDQDDPDDWDPDDYHPGPWEE